MGSNANANKSIGVAHSDSGCRYVRSVMIYGHSIYLAQAVTIAVRYSCVRRQGELHPGQVAKQPFRFTLSSNLMLVWQFSVAAK